MSIRTRITDVRAVLGVSAVLLTGGIAAQAHASTIVGRDCGEVPANGSCSSPSSSYGGDRHGMFRLANGSGVLHTAILFDVRAQGSAMDVCTGTVHVGSSISTLGENNSSSAHHYLVYQLTVCT